MFPFIVVVQRTGSAGAGEPEVRQSRDRFVVAGGGPPLWTTKDRTMRDPAGGAGRAHAGGGTPRRAVGNPLDDVPRWVSAHAQDHQPVGGAVHLDEVHGSLRGGVAVHAAEDKHPPVEREDHRHDAVEQLVLGGAEEDVTHRGPDSREAVGGRYEGGALRAHGCEGQTVPDGRLGAEPVAHHPGGDAAVGSTQGGRDAGRPRHVGGTVARAGSVRRGDSRA